MLEFNLHFHLQESGFDLICSKFVALKAGKRSVNTYVIWLPRQYQEMIAKLFVINVQIAVWYRERLFLHGFEP